VEELLAEVFQCWFASEVATQIIQGTQLQKDF